ncbi:RND family efflux transporter MFP subunit [Desulfosalsimonas propionicica]|uniref:RND family efflux transporter MFP subunit n=1 Tax=Desulfosalsimonas propionicica TaxID=332175 RepID=A0A7W0HJS9_9BACT|nr:efflux RND transporter periplasmic adaptor subunit [Desulfosalsimonas propionicica]MBA2880356.1 RND family efflux transporter MFP subunit [Desulfosalsimonas propionicica]
MIRRFSQWFILLAAIFVLLAAAFYIQHRMKVHANRTVPVKKTAEKHPNVSVVTVDTARYRASVSAHAAAFPHFDLTLVSQVSGRVQSLAEDFEPGKRLKKGHTLARLEDSDYRAEVAAAKQDLSDAQLNLLEENREALQAKAEWEASGVGGKPESELVLRKPQVAAAEAAVANARAALASARKDLARTRITAPFDALVVERMISPGSYVQAGTDIARLYSTDRAEIFVSLSAKDWSKLPGARLLESGGWNAELQNIGNGQTWSARVLRAEQHLEEATRQRDLILAVDNPLDSKPPFLPGTFIKATIPGRSMENLWKLPGSALSQEGEIWYVKADDTLAAFSAAVCFSDEKAMYVPVPEALRKSEQRVLVHPLTSYMRGMRVRPVAERVHE